MPVVLKTFIVLIRFEKIKKYLVSTHTKILQDIARTKKIFQNQVRLSHTKYFLSTKSRAHLMMFPQLGALQEFTFCYKGADLSVIVNTCCYVKQKQRLLLKTECCFSLSNYSYQDINRPPVNDQISKFSKAHQ